VEIEEALMATTAEAFLIVTQAPQVRGGSSNDNTIGRTGLDAHPCTKLTSQIGRLIAEI
jgi:hypothetical protein